MNRNVVIVLIIVCVVVVLVLGGILIYMLNARSAGAISDSSVKKTSERIIVRDKFSGLEKDAINIVRNFKVQKPDYIDALMENQKTGAKIKVSPEEVTIDSLVESQLLEKRFQMTFLKKGEWRALHLDTDMGDENQTPDPQYEVYLDYHDENVVVGPVWIVDIETKEVVPRNAMASVFDRTIFNYAVVEENLKRPAGVINAISAHRFEKGMSFGGVLLLHFLKLSKQDKHSEDEIIGWTVMHEFKNEYSAYFQWKELNEIHVAKFLFDWETKRIEPRGLDAVNLMQIGEKMDSVKEIDIYPQSYTNNLNIPRTERWAKKHACRSRDFKSLCNAFAKVLEQQEFIAALSWLITDGKEDVTARIDACKKANHCAWFPKQATGTLNPDNKPELIEIRYDYDDMDGNAQSIRFLVDSEKEIVTPLDKVSRWAYFSTTPRS